MCVYFYTMLFVQINSSSHKTQSKELGKKLSFHGDQLYFVITQGSETLFFFSVAS